MRSRVWVFASTRTALPQRSLLRAVTLVWAITLSFACCLHLKSFNIMEVFLLTTFSKIIWLFHYILTGENFPSFLTNNILYIYLLGVQNYVDLLFSHTMNSTDS